MKTYTIAVFDGDGIGPEVMAPTLAVLDTVLGKIGGRAFEYNHLPAGAFTDNLPVSKGIDHIAGHRSAMSLMNVAYVRGTKDAVTGIPKGLFWDGRSESLENQALHPVEDPIELHNTWPEAIKRFKNHDKYPEYFRKAFGITNKSEITKELAAKAIAQFVDCRRSSARPSPRQLFIERKRAAALLQANTYFGTLGAR